MSEIKTKITVYIPSHNYGKYLQEAVESVLRQSIDEWELFLVDEKSTDNTREIMDLYKGDPRITIFETNKLGLPGVANFVRKHAQGEYIIRVDADDIVDENILLVLSKYLDNHPQTALVFPDYFIMDDQGGIVHYEGRQTIYDQNHLLDIPAHGACTMVRKQVLDDLGGYREDLRMQDGFDLWSKVIQEHKCGNVNVPLFYYRRHGGNLTDNTARIFHARREIKKEACKDNLKKFSPITVVIPCRENYDFYPNLWSQKLYNKTLLDHNIETCLSSSLFDYVVVTSDTPKVKEVMAKYNDDRLVFVKRESKSTTISKSVSETLTHVIKELDLGWNGVMVLSFLNSPFVTVETLEEGVYTLVMNDTDSTFAVEEIQEQLYKRTPHGLMLINHQARFKSDFDMVYASSNCAMATLNQNLKRGSLTGAKISHFLVPNNEAFFIRSKQDFRVAEILKAGDDLLSKKHDIQVEDFIGKNN